MKNFRRVMAVILSIIMVLGVIQVPYQASEVEAAGDTYTITYTSAYNNVCDEYGNVYDSRSFTINKGDSLGGHMPSYKYDIGETHLYPMGYRIQGTSEIINNIYDYVPQGDITLEALFYEYYIVTYVSDLNNDANTQTSTSHVRKGECTNSSALFNKDGYSQIGWKVNGEGDLLTDVDLCYYPITGDTTLVAQWAATIPITFKSAEGYIYNDPNQKEYTMNVVPGEEMGYTPSLKGWDGHKFTGWKIDTNNDGIGEGDLLTENDLRYYKPTVATTYIAQWKEAQSFTLTFKANGGIIDDNLTTKILTVSDGDAAQHVYASREGYMFVGWKNDATGEIIDNSYGLIPIEDMSFTAQWATTYKMTFLSPYGYIGGDKNDTSDYYDVAAGEKLTYSPGCRGRQGYFFKGWSVQGSTQIIDGSFIPTGDTTFVANWVEGYKITFYSNEGYIYGNKYKKSESYEIEKGTGLYGGPNPSGRDGYAFAGWKVDTDGDNVGEGVLLTDVDISNYQFTGDTTFIAQWTSAYTLTFRSEEGYISGTRYNTEYECNIKQGDKVGGNSPNCYNRTGYVMTGWRVGNTDTVLSTSEIYNYQPTSDTEFNAVWSSGYVITFKSDAGYIDGNSYQKEYITSIGQGDQINNTPYCGGRKGYELIGWKKEGTNTVIDNLGEYIPSGNETFIAVWGEAVTLTFNANGGYFWGDENTTSIQVLKGSSESHYLGAPTRPGYSFNGWKNESTGVISSNQYVYGPYNANITYTAQWSAAYTITFKSDEGYIGGDRNTKETNYYVKKGNIIGDGYPSVYGRPGYNFAYWSYNGTKIDDIYDYVPSGNITLKANWAKTVNVTFDYDGGYYDYSNSGNQLNNLVCKVSQNTAINDWPSTPKKESLIFAGWKLQGDTSGKIYSSGEVSSYVVGTEDIIFKATYKPAKNITLDVNGGYWTYGPGGKDHKTRVLQVESGSYITAYISDPYNENGNMFIGWKLTGDSTGKLYSSNELNSYEIGDNDLTFVAQFAEPIEITLDMNGGYYVDYRSDNELTTYKETIGKGGKIKSFSYTPKSKASRSYFAGWQINGTGTVYSTDELKQLPFNETTTVKAVWKSDGYIIRFESSEGYLATNDASAKVREFYIEPGTKIGYQDVTMTGDNFNRKGYEISYYTKNGDSQQYTSYAISEMVANSDMTFKANWSKLTKVTFNANGGKVGNGPGGGTATYTTYYKNGANIYLYQPSYNGYTFQGWSERKDNGTVGKTYMNGYTYTVNGDVTFTAIWKNNVTGAIIQPSYLNPTKTVTPSAKTALPSKKTTTKKSTPKYSNEWVKGKWYNKDGSQTYKGTMSWKSNSKGWWIEDSAGWYPTSTWQKIDGTWYYFKSDGYMASSEYYDGYWFNSDGSWDSQYYLTWKSNSTGWWVEDKSGWWPSNQWLKIDGSWYYFNGSGYMATSQYVDGWWVGANGVCQ